MTSDFSSGGNAPSQSCKVGGFLGIGSDFIAAPYSSLQINEDGSRIVLPGATREQVKGLPEFKYR
jgi:hypothetical protein